MIYWSCFLDKHLFSLSSEESSESKNDLDFLILVQGAAEIPPTS